MYTYICVYIYVGTIARLRYLPRLQASAPPLLHALLRATSAGRGSWMQAVADDVAWLRSMLSRHMPAMPSTDDAVEWMQYAAASASMWRSLLRNAQMEAISLGLDRNYTLHTPLMHLSKAGAWNLAQNLGGDPLVNIIRTKSHTCYKGVHEELHDWGYGCGSCPACELRAKGWAESLSQAA